MPEISIMFKSCEIGAHEHCGIRAGEYRCSCGCHILDGLVVK